MIDVPIWLTCAQQNSDAEDQFTAAVDELLDQLQNKFNTVSKDVFSKCLFFPSGSALNVRRC